MFQTIALVFVGGGAGSVCRYAIWLAMRPWQDKFPWATFAANAVACLLLGILLGWQAHGLLSDQRRLLLVTGLRRTQHVFHLHGRNMGPVASGHPGAVLANVVVQLAVCLTCLLLGLRITA